MRIPDSFWVRAGGARWPVKKLRLSLWILHGILPKLREKARGQEACTEFALLILQSLRRDARDATENMDTNRMDAELACTDLSDCFNKLRNTPEIELPGRCDELFANVSKTKPKEMLSGRILTLVCKVAMAAMSRTTASTTQFFPVPMNTTSERPIAALPTLTPRRECPVALAVVESGRAHATVFGVIVLSALLVRKVRERGASGCF